MDGEVAVFLWLMLVLKLPIAALFWLVWYASRSPEPETDAEDRGSGGSDRDPGHGPRRPTPPRRGPHGEPAPPAPARVRVARGKTHVS